MNFKTFKRKRDLDSARIEALLSKKAEIIEAFNEAEIGSTDYYKYAKALNTLDELENNKKSNRSKGIDPNVLTACVSTIGGLVGISMILNYESNDGIITSAAKSIPLKGLGR